MDTPVPVITFIVTFSGVISLPIQIQQFLPICNYATSLSFTRCRLSISPSESWRGPAAKRFLVNFKLKIDCASNGNGLGFFLHSQIFPNAISQNSRRQVVPQDDLFPRGPGYRPAALV